MRRRRGRVDTRSGRGQGEGRRGLPKGTGDRGRGLWVRRRGRDKRRQVTTAIYNRGKGKAVFEKSIYIRRQIKGEFTGHDSAG